MQLFMLPGVLITLFTTEIKLSWDSQPLYDICVSCGSRGGSNILTSEELRTKSQKIW